MNPEGKSNSPCTSGRGEAARQRDWWEGNPHGMRGKREATHSVPVDSKPGKGQPEGNQSLTCTQGKLSLTCTNGQARISTLNGGFAWAIG